MKKLFSLLFIALFAVSLVACTTDTPDPTEPTPGPALLPELSAASDALTLSAAEVTTDITLPSVQGVTVVWQSSHPDVINANGQVFRPSYARGDVIVTLTAFLFLDGQVTTKSFNVTVPKLPESDVEKMGQAIDTVGTLLEADVFTESVSLPTVLHGVNIEWQSSHTGFFSENGHVVRPHFDQADEEVVLTAMMSVGKQFQIFRKVVTVAKMEYKQYGLLASGPFNGNVVNANTAAPLTFALKTQAGHELHVPYGNVNKDYMVVQNPYPYIYTPTFHDEKVPVFKNTVGDTVNNGWGVAYVVVDGILDTIYDGISNKILTVDNPDGVPGAGNTLYAADITIPENGFVMVFHNSGAAIGNTLNGREFGRSVIGANAAALGQAIELVGLELDSVGVEFRGGVFWRGFVDITVPFKFINPHLLDFDYNSTTITNDDEVPAADGTNVTGAYPLLFNAAFFDTFGGTAVNTGQGFTLAAVMRPEAEATQTIEIGGEEKAIILSNPYEVIRVFDGIGGGLKQKGAAQAPLAGGDSGKNMFFERDGFLAFWANNGVSYAQDTHNRRISADYFYAVENWVWGFKAVSQSEMIARGYVKLDPSDVLADMSFQD